MPEHDPLYAALGAGYLGAPSTAIGPSFFVDDALLRFPGPGGVFVAGFDIACPFNQGPLSIEVYSLHRFLGSTTVNCGAFPGTFLGMASSYPISLIATLDPGLVGRSEVFDNLVFGPLQDDLVFDFGAFGTWVLYDNGPNAPITAAAVTSPRPGTAGVQGFSDTGGPIQEQRAYAQLHASNPEEIATGDIDGNGRKDAILDFPGFGVWAWMNDTNYVQLHTMNVAALATGDLDGGGKDDVLMEFPGFGIWIWLNNASFVPLHTLSPTRMVAGDLDDNGKDDVIVDFPGAGLWVWFNNSSWFQLHSVNPTAFVTGDIDSNGIARADVIVAFPGFGIWAWMNNTSWVQLHTLNCRRHRGWRSHGERAGRPGLRVPGRGPLGPAQHRRMVPAPHVEP